MNITLSLTNAAKPEIRSTLIKSSILSPFFSLIFRKDDNEVSVFLTQEQARELHAKLSESLREKEVTE